MLALEELTILLYNSADSGIGIKYFAIPFNQIRIDPDKRLFIFKQGREALEQAPGFDMDHWPDTNIHLENVNSYWSFMG
jgi:hypothetical protein